MAIERVILSEESGLKNSLYRMLTLSLKGGIHTHTHTHMCLDMHRLISRSIQRKSTEVCAAGEGS